MKVEKISKEAYRVGVINSIKHKHPDKRQGGKAYTFGFSYGAGPKKYGEDLYNAYWKTYAGVRKYADSVIQKAREQGYLVSKFSGLRLWLPSIEAPDEFVRQKEERVATNFAIQSGNFLMLIAINNLQKWVEAEDLISDIKVVNTVHDSVYLYVRKDPEVISKLNQKLIEVMCDPYEEDLPIALEAEMEVGPNMVELYEVPNNASAYEIAEQLNEILEGA
jgi:DNA polymerase-1